jgi:hypothetical protein
MSNEIESKITIKNNSDKTIKVYTQIYTGSLPLPETWCCYEELDPNEEKEFHVTLCNPLKLKIKEQ